MVWNNIILVISISLLSPEFVLNKFYPKYNYLDINQIQNSQFDPKKEIRIKITRFSEYGERYKLFVIEKNTFEESFTLEDYGINLIEENNLIVVDTIKWNGEAKKSGIEMGDLISEFKLRMKIDPIKTLFILLRF